MKKRIYLALLAVCTAALASCASKTPPPQQIQVDGGYYSGK